MSLERSVLFDLLLGSPLAQDLYEAARPRIDESRRNSSTLLFDSQHLDIVRELFQEGNASARAAVAALSDAAHSAAAEKPLSVVDKAVAPPGGDLHDYCSLAKYWWPDDTQADGLPYLRKDGQVNPECYDEKHYDAIRLRVYAERVLLIATAAYLTSDLELADAAVRMLRAWHIDPATRQNPHFAYAQIVPGKPASRSTRLIEARHLVSACEAARLVRATGAIGDTDHAALQAWFKALVRWMRDSPDGGKAAAARNNIGFWYDVSLMAFADFAGLRDLVEEVVKGSIIRRIAEQIEPDGRMPLELGRERPHDYVAFTLVSMALADKVASGLGCDLWRHEEADGRSLSAAYEWFEGISLVTRTRGLPLLRSSAPRDDLNVGTPADDHLGSLELNAVIAARLLARLAEERRALLVEQTQAADAAKRGRQEVGILLNEAKQKAKALDGELAQARDGLVVLERERDSAREDAKAAHGELQQARDGLVVLERERDSAREDAKAAHGELAQASEKLKELEERQQLTGKQLEEARAARDARKASLERTKARLSDVIAQRDALKNQLRAQKAVLSVLQSSRAFKLRTMVGKNAVARAGYAALVGVWAAARAPAAQAALAKRKFQVMLAKRRAPPVAALPALDERVPAHAASATAPSAPPEPGTFALYRIIGNDLVPRHAKGQSRANLQFILENEPELPQCTKYWVVNRIFDADEEAQIIALLRKHNQDFVHIPFVWEEYKDVDLDVEVFPKPEVLFQDGEMGPELRMRALVQRYRHKNNYVMHNNGGRNTALEHGRSRAEWVLPWDGNCFLTAEAWQEIRADIAAKPDIKYFTVPMARMLDNKDLLEPGFRPAAEEEPQVVFHHEAEEKFDEAHPYGRRPKVAFFWRLGIQGAWDRWKNDPWDIERPPLSPHAGRYASAGWVARLFSGQASLEVSSKAALVGRGHARIDSILDTIRVLEKRRFSENFESKLSIYSETSLENFAKHANAKGIIGDLAMAAKARAPSSPLDKTTMAPSGVKRDYWHPAPYWWPDPKKPDGLPYIRRDGVRVPGTELYDAESHKFDRTNLQVTFDDVTVLAIAFKILGDRGYRDVAIGKLRAWFIDADTSMTPHLQYAQVRMGHSKNRGQATGIIEMKDIYFMLDAVRMLDLDIADTKALKAWLGTYLDWLLTSPQGSKERASNNNHGTYYDLQVAAIASYLGERDVLIDTFERARARLPGQFAADGTQPEEMDRTLTAHYFAFNLQGWLNLARIASACGFDLWDKGGDRSIRNALAFVLAHRDRPWPYKQIAAFDADRLAPLSAAAAAVYGMREPSHAERDRALARSKLIFDPHDGIQPLWQLSTFTDAFAAGEAAAGASARAVA